MKQVSILIPAILILMIPMVSFAGVCGDANGSDFVDLLDITYIINYLYKGGPAPACEAVYGGDYCADASNNGILDILDLTFIINYLYKAGPEPRCGCGRMYDNDDNSYETIVVGDRCWMAENLRVTSYRNGEAVLNLVNPGDWSNLSTGAYCEYSNDSTSVPVYGRLYNWFAVNDSRGLAPEGWHVASDAEWKELEIFLGMSQASADSTGWRGTDEGGQLKEAGTAHWLSPNTGGTDESGLRILPGGYRTNGGYYYYLRVYGTFWAATEYDNDLAWLRSLHYTQARITRSLSDKHFGFSVRCVRD